MKPLLLNGHSRALTQIRYNTEGDLLFSVSKDNTPSVWFSHNGERLGTFDGHAGTVWAIDVSYRSDLCLTGSADCTTAIWDVATGVRKVSLVAPSPVRSCLFSYNASSFLRTTAKAMGQPCLLQIFSMKQVEEKGKESEPLLSINVDKEQLKPITSAIWGPCDEYIVTGHEDGTVAQWNPTSGELLKKVRPHTMAISDMQSSPDFSMLITSSKDTTAKLYDMDSLDVLKEYKTDRPVNSAAISPLKETPYVVLGGGQEAMSVTTTHGRAGKFEARFFHMVFEEELGRVKGHFGPINTLAFHPSGRGYASGGEDGYIRVHQFDQSFYDFQFEH